MNKIDNLKTELAKAIKESSEYAEYKEAYRLLEKHPDLKRAVDEYRRNNFLYQSSHDVEDPLGASLKLRAEFADIKQHEVVTNFLMAEMRVCRLVRDVCTTIVDELDFDMNFLS